MINYNENEIDNEKLITSIGSLSFPAPGPLLHPNLYLPALAPNLYLPALAPNLHLPALAPTLCLPALAPICI